MRIEELLRKPLWQMTGEELLLLYDSFPPRENSAPNSAVDKVLKKYEYGIQGIANVFGCSIPTANRIKKSGIIDKAITQVGRKIVIDADLALALAKERKAEKK